MFESDQHEIDEEYEGYRHPAPPSPPPPPAPATSPTPAKAQTAPTPVAAAAVEEPVAEEPREEQEESQEEEAQDEEFVDPAQRQQEEEPPPKKKKPNLLLIGGFAALAAFAVFVFMTASRPKQNTPPPGDLGPGIVAVSGLRGHLDTRWEGDTKTGRLAYQLRIEPMEDRWEAGFSKVTSNPPMPISVNIRLMDSTGFALCGKEVDFHFDPQNAAVPVAIPSQVGGDGKKVSQAERNAAMQAARQSEITRMRAEEVVRERGKDIFQNQTTADGQVSAVNVQGTLPCSPDQYRRADYWDINTNFPTLAEQAALVDPKAAALARELEAPEHPGKRTLPKLPQEGFVIQGDERVTGYDSARGVLWAEGKTFQIDKRYGQATATAWANNYSLIHYRCDQHANCALTAAGEAAVLHARLSE
jgi:hypothetical protein